jgi:hypothetical protein
LFILLYINDIPKIITDLSQPVLFADDTESTARGWVKVRRYTEVLEQGGFLSLLSIYGYRLVVGYFGVVKGGGEGFPRFPSEFGGHGLGLCFGISVRELVFGSVGRPVEKDCSLESSMELCRRPGIYGAKTGLVWGS